MSRSLWVDWELYIVIRLHSRIHLIPYAVISVIPIVKTNQFPTRKPEYINTLHRWLSRSSRGNSRKEYALLREFSHLLNNVTEKTI